MLSPCKAMDALLCRAPMKCRVKGKKPEPVAAPIHTCQMRCFCQCRMATDKQETATERRTLGSREVPPIGGDGGDSGGGPVSIIRQIFNDI